MGIIYWAGVVSIGSQIFANEQSNKEYTTPTQDASKQTPINFYLLKMMLEAGSSFAVVLKALWATERSGTTRWPNMANNPRCLYQAI